MTFLSKILGDQNEREIKRLQKIVDEINALEPELERFSDDELRQKTQELKSKAELDSALLNEILPQAFALVREAAKRTLGQRHYDVQLIGGVVLHEGKIAEMRTGEGKTLAATAPLYLNALSGKGAHVVTVNDYLAKRDAVWMGQIYYALGLSVGVIVHDAGYIYDPAYIADSDQNSERDEDRDELGSFKIQDSYLRPCARKDAYMADITYGTNNEFGFDYLRDNLARSMEEMSQRGHSFAIIDEVDSILIDEARTPLIISAPDEESTTLYKTFAQIVPRLKKEEDYKLDEKMRAATITEEGVLKLEKILGIENIYDSEKGGGIRYVHQIEQALKAIVLFQKDKDYVVKDGEIIIVDEFTGRLMPGRRYSEGLHQALEAKEGLNVQRESRTLASITFQNYFRMYDKLAGMTGTALTSAEEFDKVYELQIVAVPTNKPMVRHDMQDVVFRTKKGQISAVVEEVKKKNKKGQPILIGTTSIENNELLSAYLSRAGIKHELLNAKNHEREGAIIAQAGRFGAVTVATNMAGRGVDIILGGNPPSPAEAEKVRCAGGLFVLGTERHEARRIDNQLRGRAGRQGDPGETQFFVSLEDDLMRIFGGDKIRRLMETFKIPEDQPIKSGLISNSIESAQSKIEGYHFDARKHVLDYDEVLNKQRGVVYDLRKQILDGGKENEIIQSIREDAKEAYMEKEKKVGPEHIKQLERFIMLRTLDILWMEHLETMESLRDSVKLRAYGQKDPLVEYKREGREMFNALLNNFKFQVGDLMAKAELQQPSNAQPRSGRVVRSADAQGGQSAKNIGRNDPCYCGATHSDGRPLKYKKCHGKNV